MGTARTNGSLYVDIRQRVAVIEFGHPAGNSFVLELLARLEKALLDISGNEEVHAILLKSEGDRAFCGGASFDELIAIENPEQGTAFFSGFANVLNAMRQCPQIIVGRIQGKAVGGGVGLAAACDLVFAAEAAAVKLSELAIGIAPLVIEPAVSRKIGTSGFAELCLQPDKWKNAYWAKEKGLFNEVFDSVESLDKEVDQYISSLQKRSPHALREIKKILWRGNDHWEQLLTERAEQSGRLALLPLTKERLAALKK